MQRMLPDRSARHVMLGYACSPAPLARFPSGI